MDVSALLVITNFVALVSTVWLGLSFSSERSGPVLITGISMCL